MIRRSFISGLLARAVVARFETKPGERFVTAARLQLGVTTGYDPAWVQLTYPNGDVPRSTGVCADVVIRAARDGLALDLQKLVHEDMLANFAAYPRTWGYTHTDANIDHRRVLNLECYWTRTKSRLWSATRPTPGDAFPNPLAPGDLLTWMLNARLPHVGIVSSVTPTTTLILNNVGRGVEELSLTDFRTHQAKAHYRWPAML